MSRNITEKKKIREKAAPAREKNPSCVAKKKSQVLGFCACPNSEQKPFFVSIKRKEHIEVIPKNCILTGSFDKINCLQCMHEFRNLQVSFKFFSRISVIKRNITPQTIPFPLALGGSPTPPAVPPTDSLVSAKKFVSFATVICHSVADSKPSPKI